MTLRHIGDYNATGPVVTLGDLGDETGALILAGSDIDHQISDGYNGPGILVVGGAGDGAAILLNRARLSASTINVAQRDGAHGLLAITSGARVDALGGGVTIGAQAGSTGSIGITGGGSLLESRGGIGLVTVGQTGSGRLTLSAGGGAHGTVFEIGADFGGRGEVKVTGPGSVLQARDEFGTVPLGAQINIATAPVSYGRLDITSGGRVEVQHNAPVVEGACTVTLGRHDGSHGVLRIEGTDGLNPSSLAIKLTGPATPGRYSASGFDLGPQLVMGVDGGRGEALVRNGGSLTVFGDAARIVLGDSGRPGGTGTGVLQIQNGGDVHVASIVTQIGAEVVLGARVDSDGTLQVNGPGARLTVESDVVDNQATGARLTVGQGGIGTLQVEDGGIVLIDGGDDRLPGLILGAGDAGYGSSTALGIASITGPGSALIVQPGGGVDAGHAGLVAIGYGAYSYGLLFIGDGGVLENVGAHSTVAVAQGFGSFGGLTVTGFGSQLVGGALISVGNALSFGAGVAPDILGPGGRGELTIGQGATVSAQRTLIAQGSRLDMDGRVFGTVEVSGTLAMHSGPLDPEPEVFDGSLILHAGATLQIDVDAILAENVADRAIISGELVIDGPLDVALAGPGLAAYEIGQQIVLFEATAIAPFVDQIIAGTDFVLRNLGNRVVLEATASRDAFTFRQVDTGNNKLVISDDAGSVHVVSGSLIGQTATGVQLIIGSDQADKVLAQAGLSWDGVIQTGGGNDVVIGSDGDNQVFGEGGADRLYGRGGADRLDGGAGRDLLSGGQGRDVLTGGAGQDQLFGDVSADRLDGGGGDDALTGGAGADVFVFTDGFGLDRVTDFQAGVDRLDFAGHFGVVDFADLTIAQTADGASIADGSGGVILLLGVDAVTVTADQFVF